MCITIMKNDWTCTYMGASAAIALYLAGETDVKTLGMAALAGFFGPVLKWLDPSATQFGRGAN